MALAAASSIASRASAASAAAGHAVGLLLAAGPHDVITRTMLDPSRTRHIDAVRSQRGLQATPSHHPHDHIPSSASRAHRAVHDAVVTAVGFVETLAADVAALEDALSPCIRTMASLIGSLPATVEAAAAAFRNASTSTSTVPRNLLVDDDEVLAAEGPYVAALRVRADACEVAAALVDAVRAVEVGSELLKGGRQLVAALWSSEPSPSGDEGIRVAAGAAAAALDCVAVAHTAAHARLMERLQWVKAAAFDALRDTLLMSPLAGVGVLPTNLAAAPGGVCPTPPGGVRAGSPSAAPGASSAAGASAPAGHPRPVTPSAATSSSRAGRAVFSVDTNGTHHGLAAFTARYVLRSCHALLRCMLAFTPPLPAEPLGEGDAFNGGGCGGDGVGGVGVGVSARAASVDACCADDDDAAGAASSISSLSLPPSFIDCAGATVQSEFIRASTRLLSASGGAAAASSRAQAAGSGGSGGGGGAPPLLTCTPSTLPNNTAASVSSLRHLVKGFICDVSASSHVRTPTSGRMVPNTLSFILDALVECPSIQSAFGNVCCLGPSLSCLLARDVTSGSGGTAVAAGGGGDAQLRSLWTAAGDEPPTPPSPTSHLASSAPRGFAKAAAAGAGAAGAGAGAGGGWCGGGVGAPPLGSALSSFTMGTPSATDAFDAACDDLEADCAASLIASLRLQSPTAAVASAQHIRLVEAVLFVRSAAAAAASAVAASAACGVAAPSPGAHAPHGGSAADEALLEANVMLLSRSSVAIDALSVALGVTGRTPFMHADTSAADVFAFTQRQANALQLDTVAPAGGIRGALSGAPAGVGGVGGAGASPPLLAASLTAVVLHNIEPHAQERDTLDRYSSFSSAYPFAPVHTARTCGGAGVRIPATSAAMHPLGGNGALSSASLPHGPSYWTQHNNVTMLAAAAAVTPRSALLSRHSHSPAPSPASSLAVATLAAEAKILQAAATAAAAAAAANHRPPLPLHAVADVLRASLDLVVFVGTLLGRLLCSMDLPPRTFALLERQLANPPGPQAVTVSRRSTMPSVGGVQRVLSPTASGGSGGMLGSLGGSLGMQLQSPIATGGGGRWDGPSDGGCCVSNTTATATSAVRSGSVSVALGVALLMRAIRLAASAGTELPAAVSGGGREVAVDDPVGLRTSRFAQSAMSFLQRAVTKGISRVFVAAEASDESARSASSQRDGMGRSPILFCPPAIRADVQRALHCLVTLPTRLSVQGEHTAAGVVANALVALDVATHSL